MRWTRLLLVPLLVPATATAEGTAQLGANQDIREDMVLFVDILGAMSDPT